VKLGEVPMKLLRQLYRTGLYGFSIEEAAERLICEGLRQLISQKQLVLRMRK
jgi:hypothetical protein